MALIPKEAFTALADTQQSMAEMLELLREIRDLLAEQQPLATMRANERRGK